MSSSLPTASMPPEEVRSVYFYDRLYVGWTELLCCPEASGCAIRLFHEKSRIGGEVLYYVSKRLSYSQYVPRYEIEVIQPGLRRPSVVCRLEKEETVLRAKFGEFMRLVIWHFKASRLDWEDTVKKKGKTKRSVESMKELRMAISLQAKIDHLVEDGVELTELDEETARWNTKFSFNDPKYDARVVAPARIHNEILGRERHGTMSSMNQLTISVNNAVTGTAKTQSFARAMAAEETQPYLGVQINMTAAQMQEPEEHDDGEQREVAHVEHALSLEGLTVLAIALAWSESTMAPPVQDLTPNFVRAHRVPQDAPDSARAKRWPADWSPTEVKSHLDTDHDLDWIQVHSFGALKKYTPSMAAPDSPSMKPAGEIERTQTAASHRHLQ